MDDLFRFVLVRPPTAPGPESVVSLDQNSAFQRSLRLAAGQPDAIRQKAGDFVAGESYIDSVASLVEGESLRALGEQLRGAADNASFDTAAAAEMAAVAIGRPIANLLQAADFRRRRRNLVDSLVAIKLVRAEHRKPIAALADVVRTIAVLEEIDQGRPYLGRAGAIAWALRRPFQLPAGIFPLRPMNAAVRPSGIADLLMVKQQLVRYERADIAHVENVLRGEGKVREHRRKTTIEETISTETETVREEERELESAERFEMQREIGETVRHDTSLEAGLKVTGRYGPFVEFEASAGAAVTDSSERSTQFAATYASEVTSRSAQRVTEQFKERRTRRLRSEVEETNRHELTGGAEHTVGVYQWLNKVYEAQVFNYGLRSMFDFMVPEPAAYLTRVMAGQQAAGLQPPPPIDFMPDDLDDLNWWQRVGRYHATGVNPPPAPTVDVAKTFSFGEQGAAGEVATPQIASTEIAIPPDYETLEAWVDIVRTNDSPRAVRVSIAAATREFQWGVEYRPLQFRIEGSAARKGENPLAVAIAADTHQPFVCTIQVRCIRTPEALARWRAATYAAIVDAYQQRLAEYTERAAEMQAPAGVQISGTNPEANRTLEKQELKKGCLSLLTRQALGLSAMFDAIADEYDHPWGPQIDLDRADEFGPYIRFFEQAFEWQNIMYVLYPYFWTRAGQWPERLARRDADPQFEAFLKAGAARVVVPVRPGFETAVDHFLQAGEIWEGSELPALGDQIYVPIYVEQMEQLGAPGTETPHGPPWEFTLPTSLVMLRADGSLPRWRKNGDGHWVPDEP